VAKLVVIEDGTILSMLQDPAFNETIPCLFGKKDIFKTPIGSCGSCMQKKQSRRREEMAKIKSCLAGLSTDKRNLLKKLFDADQIRVVYSNAAGQVVQMTF
jgi:hypothetical protein